MRLSSVNRLNIVEIYEYTLFKKVKGEGTGVPCDFGPLCKFGPEYQSRIARRMPVWSSMPNLSADPDGTGTRSARAKMVTLWCAACML